MEPWRRGASQATGQRIVAARSPGELPVAESRDAGEPLTSAPPTTWFMTSSLRLGDGAVLRRAGITDLALLTTAAAFNSAHETRRALSELATINQGFEPQQRLRVALGLTALGSLRAAAVAIQRAANVGIDTVDILLVETPTLTRFVDAVRASLPPGVSLSVGPEGVG